MNRYTFLFALLLALLPAGAFATGEADGFESLGLMHVVGKLTTQPDGSVESVQVDSKLDAEMKGAVERSIRALRFKPVLVGGIAQPVQSAFELSLAARKTVEGKYAVSVDGVEFHPVTDAPRLQADDAVDGYELVADGKLQPPVYPPEAQQRGAMGRVLVALKFDREGKVLDTAVVSSLLYETGPGRAPRGRRALQQFERAALAAARNWRVKITSGADSNPAEGFLAMTPVVFTLSSMDLDADGQWLMVQRLPNRPIPWQHKDTEINDVGHSSGFATLGGGGLELAQSARGKPVL